MVIHQMHECIHNNHNLIVIYNTFNDDLKRSINFERNQGVKEDIILKEIKDKMRNNKIETRNFMWFAL
jgi:hypothetical protein